MSGKSFWQLFLSQLCLSLILAIYSEPMLADDYFDPWSLEVHGHKNKSVDVSNFNKVGQQAPGDYISEVYVNGNYVKKMSIQFVSRADKMVPLLEKSHYINFGVKENATPDFMHLENNQVVYDITQTIPDGKFAFDFNQQRLDISIPQEYMRKDAQGYVDPKEWSDGLNMLFLNYGYSGAHSWNTHNAKNNYNSYLNLRSGVNLAAWRLRNYSAYNHSLRSSNWNSISTYLQRDIKWLRSQWVIGESYSPSEVFDSFAFRGVQLYSDDNMQPESLRGFAPVVRGVAQSNARVTIRQNSNIIWQSYVSPGPFTIDDLYPTSASGDLSITVHEADGSERHFIQPFSAVPIMQREGHLKYSLTAGEYRSTNAKEKPPHFAQFTSIYGLPWATTLYGGAITSNDYTASNMGIGKGLGTLGAISLDATFANTHLSDDRQQGASVRFQYAKDLPLSGTSFTLTGYRYSSSGYYDFNEANSDCDNAPLQNADHYNSHYYDEEGWADGKHPQYSAWHCNYNKRSKLQINISQSLGGYGSLHLSAYQQQYWQVDDMERSINFGYNTSLQSINYSVNYAYTKTPHVQDTDQIVSLTIQVPLARLLPNSWLNFSGSASNHRDNVSSVGLSGTALANNNLSYNLQQGYAKQGAGGASGNAIVDYKASAGEYRAGYNYSRYQHQLNYGAMGSLVLHPHGITFSQPLGDTMVLVRAPEASNVKVNNNTGIYTDSAGYAVIPYVSPYHRNRITLDTANLPHNVEILNDTQTVVPTQGALAMADFPTVSGERVMLILQGADVPFGASAHLANSPSMAAGIVNGRGQVYLSGMPLQGVVQVSWQQGSCQAPYRINSSNAPVQTVTTECH